MEDLRLILRVTLEVFLKYVVPLTLIGLAVAYLRGDDPPQQVVRITLGVLGIMFLKYAIVPMLVVLFTLRSPKREQDTRERPVYKTRALVPTASSCSTARASAARAASASKIETQGTGWSHDRNR